MTPGMTRSPTTYDVGPGGASGTSARSPHDNKWKLKQYAKKQMKRFNCSWT